MIWGIFPLIRGFQRGKGTSEVVVEEEVEGGIARDNTDDEDDDAGVEARDDEFVGVSLRDLLLFDPRFEFFLIVFVVVVLGFRPPFDATEEDAAADLLGTVDKGFEETSGELIDSVIEGAGVDRSEGGGLNASFFEIDGRSLTVLTDSRKFSELAVLREKPNQNLSLVFSPCVFNPNSEKGETYWEKGRV